MFMLAAISLTYHPIEHDKTAEMLVGTWILEDFYDEADDGEKIYGLGEEAKGMMIFTPDGQASVNLMRGPLPDDLRATAPETGCIPYWACFYFGTYTTTADGTSWTINVEGGNMPSYIGTEQSRSFIIENDILNIGATYELNGKTVRAVRTFRKSIAP